MTAVDIPRTHPQMTHADTTHQDRRQAQGERVLSAE